ncbi:predicted protein [Sclerotinia sclerotiorum 1980 UF-70]|uniref:Uncharacterized protein n=2 Tax=Sclerotinia sclerotiorum (strain ATCC 18683 / 1980 / Ss-1) TaxID=665079 RepID=A7ETU7_SCLS1|nr:predicted protein [Sclerotinia sclerotiorum 1980 UF-70]APA15154.1 hypothetical protein sscle_14g099240 [Sclerotinia sclerotiorum 1980 UF-70]EDN92889.1 predicted protein [Sclerotinia sclerotiorum 1980 UF-70]
MSNFHDRSSGMDGHPSTPNPLALSRDESISRVEVAIVTDRPPIGEVLSLETDHPDWTIGYASLGGGTKVADPGSLYYGFMSEVLRHPALNINDTSNWSYYNFYSKIVANRQNNTGPGAVGPVASSIVSAKAGAIIITVLSPEAEVDRYIPRLPIGELMYQSWRDTCHEDDTLEAGYHLSDLKYIICGPIVNQGMHDTIRDVLGRTGYSSREIKRGVQTTFSLINSNPGLFQMLMETDIGKLVAGMCKNHPRSLLAKQVSNIHVWSHVPGSDTGGLLIFELELV